MPNHIHVEELKKDNQLVKQYFFTKKQMIVTSVITFISILVLVIWKNLEIESIKKDFRTHEQSLKFEAYAQLEETHRKFLKMISRPYVWAIKSEMKQGNAFEIDMYGKSLVKVDSSISIMVVDQNGKVISATSDKYEGKYFISFDSPYYLKVDHTIVYQANESVLTMAAPIMGVEKKLGTLIIRYFMTYPEIF